MTITTDTRLPKRPKLTILWTYQTGGAVKLSSSRNSIVYFGSDDGYIYAVNALNGSYLEIQYLRPCSRRLRGRRVVYIGVTTATPYLPKRLHWRINLSSPVTLFILTRFLPQRRKRLSLR